tara:strand:+ start:4106 stop:4282 length:177 start_codon:yes stop_codon:yes gene_type:complete
MTKYNYSINEILLAVEQIYNKKKIDKTKFIKTKHSKINYSEVPKSTLKLIEEAEKSKK